MGKLVNISENWKISVISVNSAISQKSSDHVYVYRNPRIYHVVEFDDFTRIFKLISNAGGCRKNFMLKISTASFETIRETTSLLQVQRKVSMGQSAGCCKSMFCVSSLINVTV